MEYRCSAGTRSSPDLSLFNLTVLAVVMMVFVGFGEELVFRGFVQARMESHWGVWVACSASALIFSVMHSGYANVTYLFFVFFLGLILADCSGRPVA